RRSETDEAASNPSTGRDGQAGETPLGESNVQPARFQSTGTQEPTLIGGIDAIWAAAVGDHLAATVELSDLGVELVHGGRAGPGARARAVRQVASALSRH